MHTSEGAKILSEFTGRDEEECRHILAEEAERMANFRGKSIVDAVPECVEKIKQWFTEEDLHGEVTADFVAYHSTALIWALLAAREKKHEEKQTN